MNPLKYQMKNITGEFAVYSILLKMTEAFFVKDFLYKVFKKEIVFENFSVDKILSLESRDTFYPEKVTVEYNSRNAHYDIIDPFVLFSIKFQNIELDICYSRVIEENLQRPSKYEILHIKPSYNTELRSRDIFEFILTESLKASFLKNSILIYESVDPEIFDIGSIKILSSDDVEINKIYLPQIKQHHIDRFIYAVNNYHRDGITLRYLLNGAPGTGKTHIINNIIKELKGKATVFILAGELNDLLRMFSFCKMFEPCVLILDDLDLIIGSRDNVYKPQLLSSFLQHLDGMLKSNIFMLAATNKKEFVDKAASRPGRFDLILDIAEIEAENYLQLVKRETDDKDIINFFTDDVLTTIKLKKVTGAFIVNLVKQMISIKKMNGKLSHDDFEQCLDLTHKGFYSSNSEHLKVIGF